jgi:hypothetical protein
MTDPFKRLGDFRLNPEPLPQHTKRMGRVYSQEEVDAMQARIAEMEAALRKREEHIIGERRDVIHHLAGTGSGLRDKGDPFGESWTQAAKEIAIVVYRRRPFTDGPHGRIEDILDRYARRALDGGGNG